MRKTRAMRQAPTSRTVGGEARPDFAPTGSCPSRSFTLQGDAYRATGDNRGAVARVEASGANVIARWNERFGGGSDLRVQAYYDRSDREDQAGFQGKVDTYDFEFQHTYSLCQPQGDMGRGVPPFARRSPEYEPAGLDHFQSAQPDAYLAERVRAG
jgi:iron complex outermembrane receptor protein